MDKLNSLLKKCGVEEEGVVGEGEREGGEPRREEGVVLLAEYRWQGHQPGDSDPMVSASQAPLPEGGRGKDRGEEEKGRGEVAPVSDPEAADPARQAAVLAGRTQEPSRPQGESLLLVAKRREAGEVARRWSVRHNALAAEAKGILKRMTGPEAARLRDLVEGMEEANLRRAKAIRVLDATCVKQEERVKALLDAGREGKERRETEAAEPAREDIAIRTGAGPDGKGEPRPDDWKVVGASRGARRRRATAAKRALGPNPEPAAAGKEGVGSAAAGPPLKKKRPLAIKVECSGSRSYADTLKSMRGELDPEVLGGNVAQIRKTRGGIS